MWSEVSKYLTVQNIAYAVVVIVAVDRCWPLLVKAFDLFRAKKYNAALGVLTQAIEKASTGDLKAEELKAYVAVKTAGTPAGAIIDAALTVKGLKGNPTAPATDGPPEPPVGGDGK